MKGIAIFGALFTGRPPIYVEYYLRPTRFRLHPDRFSNAGKTIIDPSVRTGHLPPELNQWLPIPGYADLTGCWIGGLPYARREGRLYVLKRQGGLYRGCAVL